MKDELTELKARNDRLALLYHVSNVIHSTLDPHEALELILGEAVRVMRATSGSIVLINPNTGFLEIEAWRGLPPQACRLKLRVGEGITGWVARHAKPARVADVSQDARYIMIERLVKSELAVPLEVNGEIRGVLNVDSDRLNAFSADDEELLQELAVQAAKVIHNTWLYEQLRLKARLFESLFRVAQAINSTFDLDEALTVITREAAVLMEAKMCSLLMLDESRDWLDLRACFGAGPDYISKPRLSVAESLLGIVIRRKKPIQVENVQISTRYQNIEIARREGLVSLLSVPLVFRGQATGALSVYTGEPHSFSNEEIRILAALADLSAIALEKARLYERLVNVEEELRRNEKLSAIGLIAAEVAHEIRNPLTVMKMLFHSLGLDFPESDPRARDVQIMAAKMDHLNKIVEQVLDLARSSEPHFSPVNVNQLIGDLGLLLRHKLSHQNIEWSPVMDPELPLVEGDPAQLAQAFLNLALNAIEAMPNGGKLRIISQSLRAPRASERLTHVMISFTDTGQGMTVKQQRHVFTSLLSTSKEKGSGLGLAIVAKVIEAHRGEIKVRSDLGRGSTFKLILPITRLDE